MFLIEAECSFVNGLVLVIALFNVILFCFLIFSLCVCLFLKACYDRFLDFFFGSMCYFEIRLAMSVHESFNDLI